MPPVQQNNYKVRIFLGPNGSGKSSIYTILTDKFGFNCGVFINADEIEKSFKKNNSYTFNSSTIIIEETMLKKILHNHSLNTKFNFKESVGSVVVKDNTIFLKKEFSNSYISAAIADFLREQALTSKQNFSFESVFSDVRKVKFIKKLHAAGYKIYFYVVSTINPAINIARVHERVKQNGHAVSEEKITSRYYKSLHNIKKAIPFTYRCFIIDNSQEYSPVLVAELESGRKTTYLNKEYQPNWVKQLL